ncbi:MAG TPA: methyltransferase domain-containing protein [Actinomycetota bacterium]|nr:methyltransferase domain-containing protein [Actinomycetota bacterium]
MWAETYDRPPNLLIEAEEPLMRSMLEGLDGEIALDAACGTGRLSRLLQERGFDVIAVDASAPMPERARRSEAATFLAAADLARLPLRSDSMDVVVCGLAMTHLGRLEDAIAELARVSRRHATLVVSDIHPIAVATGGQAFFTAADGSRRSARNHVHWPSAYAGAFHAAGLVIDRLEEIFVDEEFLQTMATPQIRADAGALLGLPLVLAWRLTKA